MPNITQRTALALFVGFLCFYGALAATGYIGGDHALFTYVGLTGSYAHAPGYPIFSWFCRIFASFGTNAYVATIIGTGVLGALSIAVFFRGLRAWDLDQLASVAGAVAFGLIPHVVFLHTQAAVFALNHLFVSAGPVEQWSFLLTSTVSNLVGLGVLAAIWGGYTGLRRQRALTVCLLAGAILSGPVFAAMLHRPPEGLDTLLVQKFHVLFFWHLAALSALAIHNWTHVRSRQVFSVVWCVLLAVTAVVHTKELQDSAPASYVADLWYPLPDNAVLIATGDHATAGSWAYNAQRGSPGFTIAADLLAHGWYRRQVNAALGIETVDRGENVDLEEVIRAVQATGRPVFMTSILNPNLARTFPSYPLGLTIAILKPGERPPSIMEVAAQNATLFEKFGYQGPVGHTGPWAETVRAPYAGTWATLAGAFDQMGNVEAATNANLLGAKYEATHE